MKVNRNSSCPCGSGKKYKSCCIDKPSYSPSELINNIKQSISMNPNLTIDEMNAYAEYKINEHNNLCDPQFCGLSPNQVSNWLYAPFNELNDISVNSDSDLSMSPVMSYLALILEEAIDNNHGSFKATKKGNLPLKIVNKANEIKSRFAVCNTDDFLNCYEFSGKNEDAFNALNYARSLAEISGIIYLRTGHFHVKKEAQKHYKKNGINSFLLPMLEAATYKYNWGYFDSWDENIDLRPFWVFMLWRVQQKDSFESLLSNLFIAFPNILTQIKSSKDSNPEEVAASLLEVRFVRRFLGFWGFAYIENKPSLLKEERHRVIHLHPTLNNIFNFNLT